MEINVINESREKSWNRFKKDFLQISMRTQQLLKLPREYSASVIFVDAAAIHEINRAYRHIDRPTDVISFALKDEQEHYEMMDGEEELGDIFINIDAIRQQAADYGHSLRREVCFLFTHGLLHLLGYDHMQEDEEREMFALQDVILDEIVPKTRTR